MCSGQLIHDILDWDVQAWKPALALWDRRAGDMAGARVLDIGANKGGLSLYFALKGCRVTCSDLSEPTEVARQLHEKYNVSERVEYAAVDATRIPYGPGSFDAVCFKSILGGIGRDDNFAAQQHAIAEMHRVLKPGGKLFFAENLAGSRLHQFCRRKFIPWGNTWRYVTRDEMLRLLQVFSKSQYAATGFFSAFGRREWQRSALHGIDIVARPITPEKSRYIIYGCAVK